MATMTAPPPEAQPMLDEVELAFGKRREMAQRLSDQDRYVGEIVRLARERGATWAQIAERAHTSDVAVIKAARRPSLGSKR